MIKKTVPIGHKHLVRWSDFKEYYERGIHKIPALLLNYESGTPINLYLNDYLKAIEHEDETKMRTVLKIPFRMAGFKKTSTIRGEMISLEAYKKPDFLCYTFYRGRDKAEIEKIFEIQKLRLLEYVEMKTESLFLEYSAIYNKREDENLTIKDFI
jgi:hypothetical protein